MSLGTMAGTEEIMTRFFAGVLSVIAVTLIVIAYGLLRPTAAFSPNVATLGLDEYGRTVVMTDSVRPMPVAARPIAASAVEDMRIARPAVITPSASEQPRVVSAQAPKRDW